MGGRRGGIALAGLTCLIFLVLAAGAMAHVPRFTPGEGIPKNAPLVEPASASWVYYGRLPRAGEARYYRLHVRAGDRIHLRLLTPQSTPYPDLALIGPGLAGQGMLPAFVHAPPGESALVVPGKAGVARYEPFTPGAYWYPAEIDIQAPASSFYYVAVFSETTAGDYGLTVGYEERYSVAEWLRLPADLLGVYAWDDGWVVAVAPIAGVLAVGGGLLAWRTVARRRRARLRRTNPYANAIEARDPSRWLALAAGLFCLTTSANVLAEMLRALGRSGTDPGMGITGVFIGVPAVIGGLLLWLGWRTTDPPRVPTRVAMFLLGIGALVFLAGYFAGPALAILAALAPPRRGRPPAMTLVGPADVGRGIP